MNLTSRYFFLSCQVWFHVHGIVFLGSFVIPLDFFSQLFRFYPLIPCLLNLSGLILRLDSWLELMMGHSLILLWDYLAGCRKSHFAWFFFFSRWFVGFLCIDKFIIYFILFPSSTQHISQHLSQQCFKMRVFL